MVTDYLQSFRFYANIIPVSGSPEPTLVSPITGQAGFMSMTSPTASVDTATYKEGQWVYARKFPGNPIMDAITLTRGVARSDTTFWAWMSVVMEGGGEYRADIDIKHFHRDNSLTGVYPPTPNSNSWQLDVNAVPGKTYHLHECYPGKHSTAGELSGAANEISIMSLDINFEYFDVEDPQAPA